MKALKIIGIVILGFFLFFAAVFGAAWWGTSKMTAAGEKFFEFARESKVSEAYALTSSQFKDETSETEFKELVDEILADTRAVSFASRSVSAGTDEGTTGELGGTIEFSDGILYVKVDMIKENDEWRVHGMRLRQTEFPDEDEL